MKSFIVEFIHDVIHQRRVFIHSNGILAPGESLANKRSVQTGKRGARTHAQTQGSTHSFLVLFSRSLSLSLSLSANVLELL